MHGNSMVEKAASFGDMLTIKIKLNVSLQQLA